jgi:hypothetical protein
MVSSSNSKGTTEAANMRTRIATKLTLVFVLGINGSSNQVRSQERSKEAVHVLSQGPDGLAGCYQVARVSWSPQVEDIQMIPTRFELSSVPRLQELLISTCIAYP